MSSSEGFVEKVVNCLDHHSESPEEAWSRLELATERATTQGCSESCAAGEEYPEDWHVARAVIEPAALPVLQQFASRYSLDKAWNVFHDCVCDGASQYQLSKTACPPAVIAGRPPCCFAHARVNVLVTGPKRSECIAVVTGGPGEKILAVLANPMAAQPDLPATDVTCTWEECAMTVLAQHAWWLARARVSVAAFDLQMRPLPLATSRYHPHFFLPTLPRGRTNLRAFAQDLLGVTLPVA